ncbi:MAG: AAA family ATPase, partial [Nitriliruptorales bacterium]|nr:AAA family ATPase [Nitriliruptorales bacterium]
LAGGALPDDQRTLIDSLDTPILHQRTTQAVADYLTAAARRRPLVLVLDDLHWADTLSLALVERLMDLTATEPLVLLLVMRPNQEDLAWRLVETAAHEHADRHTAVELESLDVGATAELLRRLLGGLELDEGLRTQVLDRAGGNPLFVEEIVHALSPTHSEDAGRVATDEISVPPSLTGLLTARLDRLDESARHLAQVASVIGREFDAEVLAAVADHDDDLEGQVEGLVRDGILERRGHRPRASFAFRHPLIRETAYSTVLLRTRRELHGRVARQLVDRDPEASAEIAHHFIDADEPAAAFPHLVAAGRTAVRSMALSDAIRFFSAALDHRPDDADPELVLAAHDGLGQAYALVPDLTHASAAYQSLLEFGKRSGRRHLEVAALNRLGFSTATLAADWDQAMAYLRSARIIAEEIHDEDGLAEYHMNACLVNALQGNFDTSVEHDTEVARIGETAGNETVRIVGLLRRTTNLVAGGRYDEAAAGFDDAWQAAREVQHEEALAVLECNGRAVLRLRDGDVAGAMELLRRHLPTLDRFASFYAASSHHWMAQTARLAGDVETALAAYAAAERLGRSVGQPHAVCAGMAGRAHVLARCGLTSDLGELRAEAEATVTTPAGEFYSSSTWTDLAGASLQLGELDRAERELSVALETSSMTTAWERPRILLDHARLALVRHEPADATGHLEAARGEIATKGLRVYEPELFVLDGMLATSEGRGADAITVLREAERAAAESGQQLVLVEALGRLADARDRAGDLGAARSLRERARSVVEEVAGRIVDEELRASLRERQFAGVGVVDPDAAGSG